MLDYDSEATRYDVTRGGDARADAAAAAISSLLPADAERIVDAACGTGIVAMRLVRPGRAVIGVDRSAGMAALAGARMPGRIAVGDVTRLPLAAGSADAVTMVWLLHLLDADTSAAAVAEAARVLRPGGLLITTVDKNDATYRGEDDAAGLVGPVAAGLRPTQTDATGRVVHLGARHDLSAASRTSFTGLGQGLSPSQWRARLESGRLSWTKAAGRDRMTALDEALAALPGQDRARPDPVYTVIALRKRPRASGRSRP